MSHKRVVKLSSHALDDYQKCPQRFWYTTMKKITPAKTYAPFERGTIMTSMMEEFYTDKQLGKPLDILSYGTKWVDPSALDDDDKRLVERVFIQYVNYYKNETWIPFASTLPLSFILYTDDNYLFIYEGTIDFVTFPDASSRDRKEIMVVDHKTYSRLSEIYPHVNQPLGYCYGMQTDKFCYNYIGLTEAKAPKDNFHRTIVKYSKQELEDWKQDTIYWFKRIADDMEYRKTRQCEGKYGICSFSRLCEQPIPAVRDGLIQVYYKRNEYSSWGKLSPDDLEEQT